MNLKIISAERALNNKKNIPYELFNSISDGIVLLREDGIITDWNSGMEKITDIKSGEALGKYVWDIYALFYDIGFVNKVISEHLHLHMTSLLNETSKNLRKKLHIPVRLSNGTKKFIELTIFIQNRKKHYQIYILNVDVTDKKFINNSLCQSEIRHYTNTDNADAIIIRLDSSLNINYINPYGLFFLGYIKEEILDKNIFKTILKEFDTSGYDQKKILINAIEKENPDDEPEVEIISGNGDAICVKWMIKIQHDTVSGEKNILLTGKEIFRGNIIKRKSKNKQSKYKSRSEDIHAIAFDFLPRGELIYVNDRFCNCFKKKYDDLIGENYYDIVEWDDITSVKEYYAALSKDNQASTCIREVRVNNTTMYIKSLDRIIFNNKGEIVKYQSFWLENVTLHQLEEALRLSEEKFAKTFRLAPISLVITTFEEGRFEEVNDAFVNLTGYTPDEIIGRTVFDINLWREPEDREMVLSRLKKGLPINNIETVFRHKNGELNHYVYSAETIHMNGTDYLISTFFDISNRLKLESDLKLSEEKFAKTFRLAPISLVITTLEEGRFEEVNDAFVNLTGYSPEEIKGKTVFDISLWREPEDRDMVLSQLKQGQPVNNIETVFRHKNGELNHYVYSAETIHMNGTDYLISTFFDISSRLKLEYNLKLSEEKFAKTFQLAPISLVITTLKEGKIEEVNDAFIKLTKYAPEDIIGKTVFDINLWREPGDRDMVLSHLKHGQPINDVETVFRHKNGELHHYIYSAEIIEMNGTDYLISTFFDITGRMKLENDLKLSEEKFAKTFRVAPISLVITTLMEGRIEEVNDTFLKHTGFSLDDTIGKTVFDINLWKNTDDRNSVLSHLRNGQGLYNQEIVFRHKNGELHNYVYSAETIQMHGTDYLISIFFDITERKKLEDDLRHSEEMYKTIFERTGSALAIIDHDIIVLANNGFLKITGYTKEQLEGKITWPEFVIPEYIRDVRKNSLKQKEAFQIKKHEFQIRDATGYLKDIYCTTVMIPGTEQFLVSFIDMTEYNYLIKQINQIATRERQRIGEVLHDNLIQYLTGISLLTRSLEIKMKVKKLKEVRDIKKVSNLIGESLHLTKNLMRGLCLVEIDEKGLPSALLEFIKSTQEIYGIPCEFIENNEPFDIDMITASELYYIAREAIHNAVKHSNATKITVSLIVNKGKIMLEVYDDGKGLEDTDIINTSGMGLKLMKFRANMIGAKLIISNNTESSGVNLKCYLNKT